LIFHGDYGREAGLISLERCQPNLVDTLNLSETSKEPHSFIDEVELRSGQSIRDCQRCGKCTVACPTAFVMDIFPGQLMQMIELGLEEEVLLSRAIWLCTSCSKCTGECPVGIDLVKVMKSLQNMCRERMSPFKLISSSFFERFLMDGSLPQYNMASGNGHTHFPGEKVSFIRRGVKKGQSSKSRKGQLPTS
jgi:heterodisulfide reductase subunit C